MNCETCRWWGAERKHDDNYPLGSCRKSAPTIQSWVTLPAGKTCIDVPRGAWPWVAFDDYCGEYQHKGNDRGTE